MSHQQHDSQHHVTIVMEVRCGPVWIQPDGGYVRGMEHLQQGSGSGSTPAPNAVSVVQTRVLVFESQWCKVEK